MAMNIPQGQSLWARRTPEQICVDEYEYRLGRTADAAETLHACLKRARQHEKAVLKGYSTNSSQPDLSNYQNTEPDLNFVNDLRIWNITLLVDSIILASGTVLCMIVALKNARNCHRKATS